MIIIVGRWRSDSVKLAEGFAFDTNSHEYLFRCICVRYLVLLFALRHWTPPPWRHSEGSRLFDVEERAWWVSFCSILQKRLHERIVQQWQTVVHSLAISMLRVTCHGTENSYTVRYRALSARRPPWNCPRTLLNW